MQAYAPRDPLEEVLTGRITLRKFRVMVEGLAADHTSPVGRKISGPWSDQHRLQLLAAQAVRNMEAMLANRWRTEGSQPVKPEPIPVPALTEWQREVQAAKKNPAHDAAEADLLKVLGKR